MIRIEFIGNLTADPKNAATATGKEVTNFTVAVNSGRDSTTFVRVSAWDQLGNNCRLYLSKGKKVYVSGTPSARGYKDGNGGVQASLDVTAYQVEFLSPRDPVPEQPREEPKPAPKFQQVEVVDEDLPF